MPHPLLPLPGRGVKVHFCACGSLPQTCTVHDLANAHADCHSLAKQAAVCTCHHHNASPQLQPFQLDHAASPSPCRQVYSLHAHGKALQQQVCHKIWRGTTIVKDTFSSRHRLNMHFSYGHLQVGGPTASTRLVPLQTVLRSIPDSACRMVHGLLLDRQGEFFVQPLPQGGEDAQEAGPPVSPAEPPVAAERSAREWHSGFQVHRLVPSSMLCARMLCAMRAHSARMASDSASVW